MGGGGEIVEWGICRFYLIEGLSKIFLMGNIDSSL